MDWEELVEKVRNVAVNPPYDGIDSLRLGALYFYKDGKVLNSENLYTMTFDKMYAIITALTETKE
jgi:hypothetical protein